MHNLQKDLERIDLILQVVDDYTQGELQNDIIGFLSKFREIKEFLEYTLGKTIHTQIDVVPNDLPRELTQKRKLLERAAQADLLLKLRDGIMWDLMQKNERVPKEGFFESYESELSQYEMICGYCGVRLDEFSVNTNCPRNRRDDFNNDFLTIEFPPREIKGTERHFFGKPFRVEQMFLKKVVQDYKAKNVLEILTNMDMNAMEFLANKLNEIDSDGKGYISQDQMFSI